MVRKQHHHGRHEPRADVDFLRCLSQAVRLVGLYKAHHPVPVVALRDCLALLEAVLAGQKEFVLAVIEGRWVCDGTPADNGIQGVEGLLDDFRKRGLHSATILSGLRLDELAAFCELLSAPNDALAPADFLRQRGVRSIRVNAERFSREIAPSAAPVPAPPVESPITAARAARAYAGAWHQKLSGLPLGSFIKTLLDESVGDADERADIYQDVLDTVQRSLERRIAESTKTLKDESERARSERRRMENVVKTVAEGRVVVDKDGRVLMMNPVAQAIAGKPLADMAGRPILDGDPNRVVTLNTSDAPDSVEVAGDEELLGALRQATAIVEDEQGRVVGTYAVAPHAAKLREAAAAKDEFISSITHELKAPLAAIHAALELVASSAGLRLTPQEQRFIAISIDNTRQLATMINEMLDMARLQSGRLPMLPRPIALGPVIHEAVDSLRPWAASRRLNLSVDDAPSFSVIADHGRIVQVLANLIANAIKSTPEGGSISVRAEIGVGPRAGKAVVCVRDTGHGIPLEMQQAIFEKFTQAAPQGRRREGVGLGLTIARELVQRHGGEIWVESEPERGAAFYFTLPLSIGEQSER